ncbi:ankyrin repeat domain-containing protein 39 homolog [Belonocnema kinseyi]|uniref:ankyrin repeat domain-containing protein 39 homolog n=1 Tax=Belonocnema kinseyi TaxID=2817044 RepID=UPI00143D4836|nr:ankyrin repeat domain-containing protein 39 homolog [Belonocnema kinseyi]
MERIKEVLQVAGVHYRETSDLLHHFKNGLRKINQNMIHSLLFPESPIASILHPQTQKTALHYVSENQYSSSLLTQRLIDLGANVNAQNINDETPLHSVLALRMKKIVDVPIKNGADVNVPSKMGIYPIQYVTLLGSLEIIEIVLRAEKPPNIQKNNTKRCLNVIKILLNERQHCIISK